MKKQPHQPPVNPNLVSVEASLFGQLLKFQGKMLTLLRGLPPDDEKTKLVSEEVIRLLDNAVVEMERSQDMDMQGRLESVYEQAKRLVDDLTNPQA
jgi:hypothetical protein